MQTVEALARAIEAVRKLGYRTREEWLPDGQGGACEIKGQKWLFLNLGATPREQLDQVTAVLLEARRANPVAANVPTNRLPPRSAA